MGSLFLLRKRHNTGLRGISAKRQLLKLFMFANSFINLKDKTKFVCFTPSQIQQHSFF